MTKEEKKQKRKFDKMINYILKLEKQGKPGPEIEYLARQKYPELDWGKYKTSHFQ